MTTYINNNPGVPLVMVDGFYHVLRKSQADAAMPKLQGGMDVKTGSPKHGCQGTANLSSV